MGTICTGPLPAQGAGNPEGFRSLSTFGVVGGKAEIADVTSDGMTLVYTDSVQHALGVVDLTNASTPSLLTQIAVAGEPTSVAIKGNIAVAAVWHDKHSAGSVPPAFLPGLLYVVDLAIPAAPVAILAIENEPVVVEAGLVTAEDRPGSLNDVSPAGLIQIIQIDTAVPANSIVKTELADVLADFTPFEKVEGLTPTPQGDLWIGLDNDGGEVSSRLVNLGPVY